MQAGGGGGEEERERTDPGGLRGRLEEQLKHGGPRRPFVLRHLCAVVLGVEPKARYLYCAPGARARQPGSQACLRRWGLPQTPGPPIMQGHNGLANKVAEHLAL